ncbi:hypothetical protein WJX74_008964 [Apatococcus lobatus]|uniref:Uncharacterized protein n=1 Tax=Apatococcus lobatus TaxID=904363 RepID=A0AAW1QTU7_9CHLO
MQLQKSGSAGLAGKLRPVEIIKLPGWDQSDIYRAQHRWVWEKQLEDTFNMACITIQIYHCKQRTVFWANRTACQRTRRTVQELREHEIESGKLCTPEQSLQAEQLVAKIEQEVEVEYGALQLLASPADHKLPGMMYDVTFPQLFRMQYTPITLEVAGMTETMTLIQGNVVPTHEMSRAMTVYQRVPVHIYLFDGHGDVLVANESAVRHHQACFGHQEDLNFKILFKPGLFEGGDEERDAVSQEAFDAIMVHQRPVHRVFMKRKSHSKPHLTKWVMIEMWPTIDPITNQQSLMVHKGAITEVKQAKNQALHEVQQRLAQQLEEANRLNSHIAASESQISFDAQTPLDKVLQLLQELLKGKQPDPSRVRSIRDILLRSPDVRQPISLESQLLSEGPGGLGGEKGRSLLDMVGQGSEHRMTSSLRSSSRSTIASTRITPAASLDLESTSAQAHDLEVRTVASQKSGTRSRINNKSYASNGQAEIAHLYTTEVQHIKPNKLSSIDRCRSHPFPPGWRHAKSF